ncbi:MAG: universal stress protein [Candidatus Sericytochromatia bacterium]|nr:universal stress protein [Candidatus Sericytochromatia bacterium]
MRVIIATDGTAASAAIFPQIGRTFRLPADLTELVVLTIHDSTCVPDARQLVGLFADTSGEATVAFLEGARSALGVFGDQARFIALAGTPGPEIVRFIRDTGCDLLLVGRGKDHAHDRALLGSVSSHVVAHAPCTVVVIR